MTIGKGSYELKGETVYPVKDARGKWRAWACRRDPDGNGGFTLKQKSKIFTAKGKKEAKAEALLWVDELNEEAEREASRGITAARTVGEYVAVFIDGKEHRIEKSTLTEYRRRATYIYEGLGGVELDELTKDMVDAWLSRLAKKISLRSANDALSLLKSALADAEASGAILKNPAARVSKLKKTKREPNALDAAERQRLIEDLETERDGESAALKMGIKLALFTGMRQGEICGLRWRNVDFAQGTIKVREAVGREGNGAYIKEPKTGGSRRDVPAPAFILDELRALKGDMRARCKQAGAPFRESYFVIGEIDGTFTHPHELYRAWWRRVKRLDLMGTQEKPPTFHDLRHTFATAAIASGADVKSVSSILGHADASMTLNIYASADPEATRRTVDEVARVMLTKRPEPRIIELDATGTEG